MDAEKLDQLRKTKRATDESLEYCELLLKSIEDLRKAIEQLERLPFMDDANPTHLFTSSPESRLLATTFHMLQKYRRALWEAGRTAMLDVLRKDLTEYLQKWDSL